MPPAFRWLFLALAVLGAAAVGRFVDLTPRVEADFFFSDDDPQYRATADIQGRYQGGGEQFILRVAGGDSAAYRATLRALVDSLGALSGVQGVRSALTEDLTSPLWGPLLGTPDGAATNVIAQVDAAAAQGLVAEIERVAGGVTRPGVTVQVSGVPYVVELIRRRLFRDFVTFSLAALVVFGGALALLYRSGWIVTGTLTSCLLACALTLGLNEVFDVHIGLLTANIVTIVFVLTLSHTVFLTANWRRASGAGHGAVRATLPASFWCMTTTALGFLTLLLASARPLRELGTAGAIGTGAALVLAFTVYPIFLAAAGARRERPAASWPSLRGPRWVWVAAIGGGVLLLAPGVLRVDTEPSLLSYFTPNGAIRDGLDAVDRDGGSSTLLLAVRDSARRRIDEDSVYARLARVHDALRADSVVGTALSIVPVVQHARRQPLAGMLPLSGLLDFLDTPMFGRLTAGFVSPDRTESLFVLRMREASVRSDRMAVADRIAARATERGFDVTARGGVWQLQAQLGRLIRRSLRFGLGGLVGLFAIIAWIVARRLSWAGAMLLGLAAIPIVVLGAMGYLRLPVDIITSPAANIAIGMGVDGMIHLVTRARRLVRDGMAPPDAWREARAQLRGPILGAALVISAGFGIFALSGFPPTRRFGLAVIMGTVTAALMALVVLPTLATIRQRGDS